MLKKKQTGKEQFYKQWQKKIDTIYHVNEMKKYCISFKQIR